MLIIKKITLWTVAHLQLCMDTIIRPRLLFKWKICLVTWSKCLLAGVGLFMSRILALVCNGQFSLQSVSKHVNIKSIKTVNKNNSHYRELPACSIYIDTNIKPSPPFKWKIHLVTWSDCLSALEDDTGVNSQTSPVPLPQKLISSNPDPIPRTGGKSRPVHSRKNDSHSLPLPCRVFFLRQNLSVTVKI